MMNDKKRYLTRDSIVMFHGLNKSKLKLHTECNIILHTTLFLKAMILNPKNPARSWRHPARSWKGAGDNYKVFKRKTSNNSQRIKICTILHKLGNHNSFQALARPTFLSSMCSLPNFNISNCFGLSSSSSFGRGNLSYNLSYAALS